LSAAKIEVEKLLIKAPFDGVVGVFRYRDGAYVQPGTVIVSVYDPADAIVELDIPSNIVAKVNDDQPVTVNGHPYTLTHVQRLVDENTHMCPALIDVPTHNFVIGASVDVDLTLEQHKGVLVLPSDAVFLRNGESFVYKVEDEKAVLVPVILGIREKDRVEIVSGLSEKDVVIACNQTRLYPGISVRIYQPEDNLKN
jgi:membrane fusion protein, multidrug efflux system